MGLYELATTGSKSRIQKSFGHFQGLLKDGLGETELGLQDEFPLIF